MSKWSSMIKDDALVHVFMILLAIIGNVESNVNFGWGIKFVTWKWRSKTYCVKAPISPH
jgi:hypothetical protein